MWPAPPAQQPLTQLAPPAKFNIIKSLLPLHVTHATPDVQPAQELLPTIVQAAKQDFTCFPPQPIVFQAPNAQDLAVTTPTEDPTNVLLVMLLAQAVQDL